MKQKFIIIAAMIGLTTFTSVGCSKQQGSVTDYQSSQMAAKNNCQRNADEYLAAAGDARTVIMDTDSSISREYLQGDGWCSGHYMEKGSASPEKMYCRSNRGGGCKPVKPDDDGKPNPNLDHTVPVSK